MSMFQNLTKFLENVDQRAGEFAAERQQRKSQQQPPTPTGQQQPHQLQRAASDSAGLSLNARRASGKDEDLLDDSASFPTVPIVPPSFTPPPAVTSVPYSEHRKQIEALLQAQSDAERRVEAANQERDQRQQVLQQDFEKGMQRIKELASLLQSKEKEVEDTKLHNLGLEAQVARLQASKESVEKSLAEARDRLSVLDSELTEAHRRSENTQKQLDVEKLRADQLAQQLTEIQQEFAEYKVKSKKVLSDRNNEISMLHNPVAALPTRPTKEVEAEVQQLRDALASKDALLEDLKRQFDLKVKELEQVLSDNSKQEARRAELSTQVKAAQELFEGEAQAHSETRRSFEALLAERDQQIAKHQKKLADLQKQIEGRINDTSPTSSGPDSATTADAVTLPSNESLAQWQQKAKDLADLVMKRQAALEAKRSEADLWRTRFEVSQQRLREVEIMVNAVNSNSNTRHTRSVSIEDEKEVQDSLTGDFARSHFFSTLSRKGEWGRRVSTAARMIDTVAVRGGIVLRRSSVLRVCFLLYVIGLHVWVFFVMATLTVPPTSAGVNEPRN